MTGAGGNVLHKIVESQGDRLISAFFRKNSGVDENHHILLALRQSHLDALNSVLHFFNDARRNDPDRERRSNADRFSREVQRFISEAGRVGRRGSGAACELERDVFINLPGAFDAALSARGKAIPEDITETARQARIEIESLALQELLLETGTLETELPSLFQSVFRRQGEGWFDLFVRDGAARLKQNQNFRSIWTAEQLARIRQRTEVVEIGLERVFVEAKAIRTETETIRSQQQLDSVKLDSLLAIVNQGGIFSLALQEGISQRAVQNIVARLGGESVAQKDIVGWLENWIETARTELGRRTNEDEAFEAARREAERLFRDGSGDASAALIAELERGALVEDERRMAHTRRRIRLLEEAIRFDELGVRPLAVVAKLRQIAHEEGRITQDEVGEFLHKKGQEYSDRGNKKGEYPALLASIAILRAAADECARERVPLEWAAIQNSLGNALAMLARRESDQSRLLRESITALRAALEERRRDLVPVDWASTQNNLGASLARLGEINNDTMLIEEGILAHNSALGVFTRESAPLDWAMVQSNLASAFANLGDREKGTERLEQAVAACLAALEARPREKAPLSWGNTQLNLGASLSRLGRRDDDPIFLERALAAYRAALEVWTPDVVPMDWAQAQFNLGVTLHALSKRETGTDRLEEAVVAFRAASTVWTRQNVPADWVEIQESIGRVFQLLGEREDEIAYFEEAVTSYKSALQERSRERDPQGWGDAKHHLGVAHSSVGLWEDDWAPHMAEALAAFRAALEVRTREQLPFDWAMTQCNIGVVLFNLGLWEDKHSLVQDAALTFKSALEVLKPEENFFDWDFARTALAETSDLLANGKSEKYGTISAQAD